MPKGWMKKEFVQAALANKGKAKRSCIYVDTLTQKMEVGKRKAWVVDIDWLSAQLQKCKGNNQETIRIAVDKQGELHIEGYEDSYKDIEGCPANWVGDPPGWNNDWPEVDLP